MNRQLRHTGSGIVCGIAAFLLLNACAIGPKYSRPQLPIPPAYKEALPGGWGNSKPNDGALRGNWWEIFNDRQLNSLEERVSISNQNVLAFEAQYRAAKAAVRISHSGLLPNVTASPSVGRSKGAAARGPENFFELPVDLGYQIDIWGNIRRGARANAAVAQATEAELENARLLYQAELASDYFELQGLDASRQLLEATVKSFEQYVQLTKDRYEGGVASLGDVSLAQTQLETARAQLIDLGVQRAQFDHAVAVLVGKAPAELSIVDMPIQARPPVLPTGLPSELLERRPDVAANERQVAAANEQIGIAKAAFFPALLLNGGAGSQASAFLDLLSTPTRFWSLGAQLAQPLFDGGKRRGQVRLAEAAYDATVAGYRQTVLTAFQQVEDTVAALRVLSDEAIATGNAIQSAQQSLDISTIQYRSGAINYLQVVTSQNNLLQNQRAAVNILTRRLEASVSLIQALGGGWDSSQLPSSDEVRH